MKEKRNWKIIYSNYSGMEKKAVELVSCEAGRLIKAYTRFMYLHVKRSARQQMAILL